MAKKEKLQTLAEQWTVYFYQKKKRGYKVINYEQA